MKKVLIAGLGRSGYASAKMLAGLNELCCWDCKPRASFDADLLSELESMGVNLIFGEAPELERFDELLLSPGISAEGDLAKRARALGVRVTGELEAAFENCRGIFVAITGTNGKTTTTELSGEMFKAAGLKAEVVGNIGTAASSRALEADEDTYMITEVSSFQLETVGSFRPFISAILNLTPDHLDRHGSFDEYIRMKARIFANQTKDDIFVYNADDSETLKLAKECAARQFAFSRKFRPEPPCAFVRGGVMCIDADGKEIEIIETKDIYIPGAHNLENALAAAAISFSAGIDAERIASVLREFKGVEHRMEFVRELDGVRYINDSKATNPDSAIKAIEAVNPPIILIAGGYEKNSDFTELIESFEGRVKHLLLLGATAERFAASAIACGFDEDKITFLLSMGDAVKRAAELAEAGDSVLLSPACASWGMYTNYEERGKEFKSLVKAL